MSFGVFLGFWPVISSALSLTGGASLALEAGRPPLALNVRMVQYQGVEGSSLRLSRMDGVVGGRWRFLEGGVGLSWLRLSFSGTASDGVYPVFTGGVRFGETLQTRLGGSTLVAGRLLWSLGVEVGFPLRP